MSEKSKVMTPEQHDHVRELQADFGRRAAAKYRRGVEEHGGDIRDLSILTLCEEMIAEAVDQFIYASTIYEKVVKEEPETDRVKELRHQMETIRQGINNRPPSTRTMTTITSADHLPPGISLEDE